MFARVVAGGLGLVLASAALSALAVQPSGAEPALGTVATVAVGSYPSAVAISPSGTTAYVANSGIAAQYLTTTTINGTVSVIDTTTTPPSVTATVTVQGDPEALALRPGSQQLYVVNAGSSSVSILNVATSPPSVIKTIPTNTGGLKPDAIAFTSTGNYAYLTSSRYLGFVDIINCATETLANEKFFSYSASYHGIAFSPDNSRVLIANPDTGTSPTLVAVNPANRTTPTVSSSISMSGTPRSIGFVPGLAGTAYVTNVANHSVTVVDATTTPPTVTASVALGNEAWDLGFTPDGHRAYVTVPGDNQLAVIDTTTTPPSVVGHDAGLSDPSGVAVTPDGNWVYVPNRTASGTVTVFPNVVPPIVTSVGPGQGPTSGGNTVTITGSNLAGTTSVLFGSVPGTAISVNATGTQLTVTAPPGEGTVPVTVNVGAAQSAPINYTYAVSVTTTTFPDGEVGQPYSATLAAAGGTGPYTWSISPGSLPPGLSLEASTGAISGTPTTGGTVAFTAVVTDSSTPTAQVASKPFTIDVHAALSITTTSLPRAAVGLPYSTTLTTSGGKAPFTWAVSAGSLPSGLSLDPSTGVISGTPALGTAGTTTFTVAVTDTLGGSTTAPLALDVFGVTTSSLPSGATGGAYSQPLSATGGTPPYSWSIASGSLPAGLTINPTTGTVSGTPTTAATSAFTVAVTDSSTPPVSVVGPLSITITGVLPPAVSGVTPGGGYQGGGTTVTITGSGFVGATGVSFGATPASSFTVQSDTEITAAAPSGSGVVDVGVTTTLGTSPVTAADQYTYTSWSTLALTALALNETSSFNAVSCASVGNCAAVGGNNAGPLAAVQSTGTWLTTPVPAAPGGTLGVAGQLRGVSCPDTGDCVAVGNAEKAGERQALVATYASGVWATQLVDTGLPSALVQLTGVSCTDAQHCVAVGYSTSPGGSTTTALAVVLTYTAGSGSWQGATSPDLNPPGSLFATLNGISCTAPNTCVAVGSSGNGTQNRPLVESLGGTPGAPSWTVADTSSLPTGLLLRSVSCPDAADCVATGTGTSTTLNGPAAAQLAGGTWTATPLPVFGTSPQLAGVSCTDATHCTAVGNYGVASATYAPHPLLETLSGGRWQASEPGSTNEVWQGISCVSALSCTTGGSNYTITTVGTSTHPTLQIRRDAVVSESLPGTVTPVVTGVTPAAGLSGGGTSVVISGGGFTGATAVRFGSTTATSFSVNWDGQITAVAPAGSGTVDVTVTGSGGTSATSTADHYRFADQPVVNSLSVSTGPATGGTPVIITGTNFTGATAVDFGTVPATGFTVQSDTQITVTSPPGVAGTVDVTVVGPGGTSSTSPADGFTFTVVATSFTFTVGGSSSLATTTYGTGALFAEQGLPPSANGTVTFTSGTTTLCVITLPATSCPSVTVPVGSYPGIVGSFVNTDASYDNSTSGNTATLEVQSTTLTTPNVYVGFQSGAGTGRLSIVNSTNNHVLSTTTVGGYPGQMAITPDGQTAYVKDSNYSSNAVLPVAATTGVAGSPMNFEGYPTGVAITSAGQTGWVISGWFGGAPGTPGGAFLTTFSIPSNTVGTRITLPIRTALAAVAVNPDGNTVYVLETATSPTENVLLPVDVATRTVGTPIVVGGASNIAITPGGTTAYLLDNANTRIDVVDLTTNTTETPIVLSGTYFTFLMAPNGSTGYLLGMTGVIPVNLTTGSVGSAIHVSGGGACHGAIAPSGKTAYVLPCANNRLTPITLVNKRAGTTVPIGTRTAFLAGIAITPDQAPVASLSVTPALAGQATSFDASASTVTFGTITSYAWDFGDGHTATTTTATTTHTYTAAGTFTASVTETDSAGTSTTRTFTGQTVSNNGGPSAVATSTVQITAVPTSFSITVNGSSSSATVNQVSAATLAESGLPATAAGYVTFTSGTTVLCVATLPATSCTTSTTLAGGAYPTINGNFTDTAGTYASSVSTNTVELTVLAPTLSALSPSIGSQGTVVTVTGTNLIGASTVNFGIAPATGITVASATSLTAVVPEGTGTVDVTVTTPIGTSATSSADEFTYSSGPVVASGSNSFGQLGNGSTINASSPVPVGGLSQVTTVAAGGYHSLALTASGNVYDWGNGGYGQLGNGARNPATAPVKVKGSGGTGVLSNVVAVAGGMYHSLALTTTGHVFAWGYNGNGQLGNGSTTSSTTPVEVKGPGGSGVLSNVVAIAAGGFHSVAVTAAGHVYSWGYNGFGQLGNGTTTGSTTPIEVQGTGGTGALSGIVAAAAGGYHSLALTATGNVYAWGNDGNGQLGNGRTNLSSSTPIEVQGTGGTGVLSGIVALAGGGYHSLALTASGAVYAWGNDSNGQLGNGTTTNSSRPAAVLGVGGPGPLTGVRTIAAGFSFSLATTNATVDGFGQNNDGQLGNGTTTTASTPVVLSGLGGAGEAAAGICQSVVGGWRIPSVTGVSPSSGPLGGGTTVMITGTGFSGATMVTFGATPAASFTVNGTTSITATASPGSAGPADVTVTNPGGTSATSSVHQFTYVAAPAVSALTPSIGSQGTVVTVTGTNLIGASTVNFGIAPATGITVASATSLTAVVPEGTGTVDVTVTTPIGTSATSSADEFTYSSGPVVASGSNSFGQLGNGSTINASSPVPVGRLSQVTTVAAGGYHSLALTASGNVYDWGNGGYGQLGNGARNPATAPVKVKGSGGTGVLSNVVAVAGGMYHSLALTTTGHVFAWGYNGNGQLGNGSTTSSTTPVEVKGPGGSGVLSNVVAIAAGGFHSVAVTAAGHVYSWGYNGFGQLGNGTTTGSTTPIEVQGTGGTGALSGIVAAAAGGYHSLALTATGNVYAWGNDGNGQLGNGRTNSSSSTPIEVQGTGGTGVLSGIVALAGGGYHSLALTASGAVYAWGNDSNGQLGNGTTTNSSRPAAVLGVGGPGPLTGVRTIAAGFSFSLATTNATVDGFGQNNDGQLGNGTTTTASTPVVLSGLGGAGEAAAGICQSVVGGWST